ncbi:hypothetical protein AAG906_020385 [Vitis piasezkii]
MDERNQGHHVIGITNFPQPNMHIMLSAPGIQHDDGPAMFYGFGDYNGVGHHYLVPSPTFIGVAPVSKIYNPYFTLHLETEGSLSPFNTRHHPRFP